jgi:hypothetical protein
MYKVSQQFTPCNIFLNNRYEYRTTQNTMKTLKTCKKKRLEKAALYILNNRHEYRTIQNAMKLKTHKKCYRINKIADTSRPEDESTSLMCL